MQSAPRKQVQLTGQGQSGIAALHDDFGGNPLLNSSLSASGRRMNGLNECQQKFSNLSSKTPCKTGNPHPPAVVQNGDGKYEILLYIIFPSCHGQHPEGAQHWQ